MESAAVFMDQMEGRALPVHSDVVTGRAKKISENRRKISSIVKTIIFFGRQNIALRGHRENITEAMSAGGPMCNPGNFISLLRFRVESGDVYLGEHFRTASERTMTIVLLSYNTE